MKTTLLSCRCGKVSLKLTGRPILTTICHCDDCQTASGQLEKLPGAGPILDDFGGSAYALYRKDRVEISDPGYNVKRHRVPGEKHTHRLYAECCSSPVLLNYEPGHWYSVFSHKTDLPMLHPHSRIQTRFITGESKPADSLRKYRAFGLGIIARVLLSRYAMGKKNVWQAINYPSER